MSTASSVPRRAKALTEFQIRNKLPADGIYGPQTKQAIAEALQQQDEALLKSSKATGERNATLIRGRGPRELPPR